MNYEVRNLIDNTYQVYNYPNDADFEDYECVFQGSLQECAAYVELDEKGLLR